jgi:glutamyl-tRNA reductase
MPGAFRAGTGGELLVIGASHRTSPPAWRAYFARVEASLGAELDRLAAAGFGEAVLLATCDRLEAIAVGEDAAALQAGFARYLAAGLGVDVAEVAPALYLHRGPAALRHLFAVASALDSLVIGEPHVLGQLRSAHRAAAEAGLVGATLESALQGAYAAARRVRRETALAERPASLAAAAVALAREIHGELDRAAVLLLGTGEMGALMAEQFGAAGVARLLVAGPDLASQRLAATLGASFAPLAEIAEVLAEAEITIAALGTGRRALSAAAVEAALRRRRRRPVFLIDAAIPGDVEPAANELDGAFLYTLDDLERVALAGRAARAAAAGEAWAVLEAALAEFGRRRAERAAVPAVTALRAHFEAMRQAVLRETPGLDAEAATRLLVNRLLHAPSETLRALGAVEGGAEVEALLRLMFRLESEEGEERQ